MALVEVTCPNCDETLKVPPTVFGKKVKCKHCEEPFVVKDPDAPAKPAKPGKAGAKPAKAAKAEATPPPPPATGKKNWDEDEGVEKVELVKEEEVPRCPSCAQELDPPDAKVCLHCGFNNLTRERATTKRVWAPTTGDWVAHLAPGVIAVVIVMVLIGLNIWFISNVREWMVGSIVDADEKDAAGRPKFYIHPAAFMFAIGIISARLGFTCAKFAYRRLVTEFTPEERVRK